MTDRYRPLAGVPRYYAGDRSGAAFYCPRSGDTHFLHVDPVSMSELLEAPTFTPDELCRRLRLSRDEGWQLIETLSAFGIIEDVQ